MLNNHLLLEEEKTNLFIVGKKHTNNEKNSFKIIKTFLM